jgi:hypothetical protein
MYNCLRSENNYLVNFGIDKIALTIETRHLNYKNTPEQLIGIMDIINRGLWSKLNIQWEQNGLSHIDNFCPLHSVIAALQCGISAGLFTDEVTSTLTECMANTNNPMWLDNLVNKWFYSGLFKFSEYELFFDFIEYNPFFHFNKSHFLNYHGTIYTKDWKRKKDADGNSKGVRRSLMCVYDRGKKIGSTEKIRRMEFRICDYRAKAILTPYDLAYPVQAFINMRGPQIKRTLTRYIPDGSIKYDANYINQYAPELRDILGIK